MGIREASILPTREQAKERYPLIEARFFDSLERYARDHIRCGGFLNAVLENDLVKAVTTADRETLVAIREIVLYVYNEMPGKCWGDPAKVNKWIERDKA